MIEKQMTEPYMTQAAGNIVSDMGDEKVMFSAANGKYYNFGDVGGRIWELLAEPNTAKSITAQLMQEYDVSEAACRQETEAFLQSLKKEGLIVVQE